MSVYAIGDLHGCPEELEVLLDHLAPAPEDELVFLGDYVDRGPLVRELVERLIALRATRPGTVFLRGNHEDMLLDYLGLGGHFGEAYLANGGRATLRSYGIPEGVVGEAAAALVPSTHREFLLATTFRYVAGRFLFVHAGIRPGVPLEAQRPEDLLWIREEFFGAPHDEPYTVVFGHTPQREARIRLPWLVGLDTGLVYGNKLSCLDVEGRRLVQVARGARRVQTNDLGAAFERAGL